MMPLIYVAGPLRPTPTRSAEQHIAEARRMASWVRSQGAYPVTPHLNTGHLFFEIPDGEEDTIKGALRLMARCDGVMLIGDWWYSSGTLAEAFAAFGVELPVFHDKDVISYSLTNHIRAFEHWQLLIKNRGLSINRFREILKEHNI